jgi:hypothetical protein
MPSKKTTPKAQDENGQQLAGLSWAEIASRYPHAIRGTLQDHSDGKWAGKRTTEIKCAERGCKARRRVATSDLFQVRKCEEHTAADRAARRAERRKEKQTA